MNFNDELDQTVIISVSENSPLVNRAIAEYPNRFNRLRTIELKPIDLIDYHIFSLGNELYFGQVSGFRLGVDTCLFTSSVTSPIDSVGFTIPNLQALTQQEYEKHLMRN